MADAGVYLRIVRAQIRSQTQYRASFVLDLVGSVVAGTLDVFTVFVLLRVTGNLGGFGGKQVLLIVALSAFAFQVADLIVGNVDRLRLHVRSGMFDALLLRPLSALWQLLAQTFAPRRVGRAVQGGVLYCVALAVCDVHWSPAAAALAVVAPIAGAVFFASLFVAGGTVAFWWIESGELASSVTYGGKDFTAYPVTMYGGLFRTLFAFGLGFAFVAYFPMLALTDAPDPLDLPHWLRWCSPLTAVIAAVAAGLFWRTGVRHYRSTGS